MSETNVRPVLFKHAFWDNVIIETVAGICTLIISLLVQQFVGHHVLGWETVVILALSVVVFSLLSAAYLQWYRHRRPDDGYLLIGIIDFVLRLLVTSGIALLLVSNITLLSIIIGAAITSVLLFVFEKSWQPGMTDAQLQEASKKSVELGVQMLEEERVKRAEVRNMIALQHASAGKTGTSRGVSLTFSSLIVANMLMEAVCDVVTFLLALMLQLWMLGTIGGWRTLLVMFLGNMLFSCVAAAVMVLMGALKADQQKCPTKSWSFLTISVLLRLLIFGVLAWLLTPSLAWVSVVVGIVLTDIIFVIKQHPWRRTAVAA
ncbi:hypothetical protein BFS15_03630 [Gardnerella sp. DNF01162]|uniref:hypothetical protein n=1 Tax=Gardnerella TaxID=2701 RepID=UPI000CBBB003|nr:hypothetical protein [Gardnerella sp. DNF01162]PNP91914.1 hypothetical protein BFS15_03630 [Gardnerella sp. DNF01162]RFD73727.1 hypothetical protein AXE72_04430 [Gardnerella vaginalis]